MECGHTPATYRVSSAEEIKVTSVEDGKIYFTFIDGYIVYKEIICNGCLVLDDDKIYFSAEGQGLLVTEEDYVFTREKIEL